MKGRYAREIAALDAGRDDARIAFLLATCEFPWDTERALEFALFRTDAVPSISGLLAGTGEFERRPRKRYDDTELILAEILENSLDSPRGRAFPFRREQPPHRRGDARPAGRLVSAPGAVAAGAATSSRRAGKAEVEMPLRLVALCGAVAMTLSL